MAQHLDLEEQEQLAELKHFWSRYGNLISWTLIVVFGAIAAYNGWNYWQRHQSAQASALFEEVERASQSGDLARVQRAFDDMKGQYGGTAYAQQAGLLAAKTLVDGGKPDEAKTALSWVAEKASDEGYQAVARLRLAAVLAEAKSYDEALKQVSGAFPKDFEALAADRRGDILQLQGKKNEARAEFAKALKGLDERAEYRRLVEVKLNALGGDPAGAPAAPSQGTTKP
ncbi:MAG TPA: tetratricopeptide repeat protein [Ramlibacter sp.]|nr:tetratricopeptide repeat protein [Ramlibacter sp.]